MKSVEPKSPKNYQKARWMNDDFDNSGFNDNDPDDKISIDSKKQSTLSHPVCMKPLTVSSIIAKSPKTSQ